MKTGVDVRISDKAEINTNRTISIGNHVSIDSWVYISTHLFMGDYIHVAPHVSVIGGDAGTLYMDHFSNIGSGSKIVVVSDDFTQGMVNPIVPVQYRRLIGHAIRLRRYATIGVNCVVLPGCDMAEGSVLGAGSVLTRPTEPWGIYVGSPAKRIGTRDKELILSSAKELGYEF
jgi:acetyltransferase-like isoleucine patch superfamily enzyme